MKHTARWVALAGLITAMTVVLVAQRLERTALQAELAQVLEEQRSRTRLVEENRRLVAAQPPAEELARLRADQAAIARFRREIETLEAEATASR